MALNSYYEPFYPQEWQPRPDGFGGEEYAWVDGKEIQGLYRQDSSTEARIAEANSIASGGIFLTGMDVEIKEQTVLRRARDSLYIKITGLSIDAPALAMSKFKKMNAERTVQPE